MHYSFLKQISLITMLLFFPIASYSMTKKRSEGAKSSSGTEKILCGECNGTKLSYLANAITGIVELGFGMWMINKVFTSEKKCSPDIAIMTAITMTLPVTIAVYFLTQTASNLINKHPFKTPCSECEWAPADQLRYGANIASVCTSATIGTSYFNNNKILQDTSIWGSIAAGFTVFPWLLKAAGCKGKTTK